MGVVLQILVVMKVLGAFTFLALVLAINAREINRDLPPLGNGIGGRIVGGQDADEGEYPWQVSWRVREGDVNSHSCGGSVLNESWVLTAGHCCNGINGGEIAAGILNRHEDTEGQYSTFTKFLHPDYNPGNTNNDVCLLKLDQPFDLSDGTITTIDLNRIEDGDWPSGTVFTVTGWGTLQSGGGVLPDILQEVEVPHVGHFTCTVEYFPYSITDGMICAGETGKDSCQGDSGGPMIFKDENGEATLVGVVSWGIGCGGWLKPGVYAEVAAFADWIEETMASNTDLDFY